MVSANNLPKPVLEPVMRTTCLEFMIIPLANLSDAASKEGGSRNKYNEVI
jgi:hypothetical protein